MRKILFRGKRKDNGGWVQGNYLNDPDLDEHLIEGYEYYSGENGLERDYFQYHVIPESVGQFIGIVDKNGVKIFEGDIFKFPDEVFESYETSCGTEYNSWECENYGVVGFCDYEARFDFVKYKYNENTVEADLHENRYVEFYDFVQELEVIGNIQDNPELMQEEQEAPVQYATGGIINEPCESDLEPGEVIIPFPDNLFC